MRRALSLFERNLATFFPAYSLIYIAFAALSPIVGDYCPYLQQWHNVSVGLDPWLKDETQVVHRIPWVSFCGTFYATAPNAYGPLFNVYGMTSLIFTTILRVLGCILFLAVSWMIAKRVHARQELDWKIRFWLYAGLLANLLDKRRQRNNVPSPKIQPPMALLCLLGHAADDPDRLQDDRICMPLE